MELQSSLEFLDTYSWFFIVVLILAVVLLVFYLVQSSQNSYSYCAINSQFQCKNASVLVTSSGSILLFKIQNLLSTTISFSNDSVEAFPEFNNVSYYGSCLPTHVVPNQYTLCSVFINNYTPSVGSQINSRFNIFYGMCTKCTAASFKNYVVSGTITVDVSSIPPQS